MKCKAVRREIEELEAGAPASAEANEHRLACAACRGFAEERARLRQLVGSLERVSAPADFDWRLRARLAEARTEREHARGWFWQGATRAQAFALAASFVFLVVAVVIYQQTRPAPRAQSAAIALGGATVNAKAEEYAGAAVNPEPLTKDEASAPVTGANSREAARTRGTRNLKPGASRADSAGYAQPQRIFSNDLGSRSAEEFSTAGMKSAFTSAGPVISVPVRSNKTAPLQFEDGQGTRRTLAPVIFGGQELIERPDRARLVPASESGIW